MSKATKAMAALERLFDRCEEIDPDGYRMLDDVWIVRDCIKIKHEAYWELIYHDDHPEYYAHYVTARCSKCRRWFWGNKEHRTAQGEAYGVRLWSAFCTNYPNAKIWFKHLALTEAEKQLKKSKDLPAFCQHCGARMRGVAYNWIDFKPEEDKA